MAPKDFDKNNSNQETEVIVADNLDKTEPDKKSSKKARKVTSGDLRKAADEKVAKAAKKIAAGKKPERLVTVEVWARGNRNSLVQAFLSEHARQRTVKRTGSAWIELFRRWKEQPRG